MHNPIVKRVSLLPGLLALATVVLAQNEARLESLRAFAREFELARLEESGRSLVIQVVDPASPPEKRSGPRKARLSVGAGFFVAALAYLVLLALHVRRLRSVRSAAA